MKDGAGLFDDDDQSVRNGDTVRVNGEFDGTLHLHWNGKFYIEGWPEDRVVHSVELVKPDVSDEESVRPQLSAQRPEHHPRG